MPDPAPETPEAMAKRLQEVSTQMDVTTSTSNSLSDERIQLMLGLHDAGWNNVQIAGAAGGLTRQRVSMILKPELERRVAARSY